MKVAEGVGAIIWYHKEAVKNTLGQGEGLRREESEEGWG